MIVLLTVLRPDRPGEGAARLRAAAGRRGRDPARGGELLWPRRLDWAAPGRHPLERGNWTFYFPLATSLLLSVLFTILFSFFSFFDRR